MKRYFGPVAISIAVAMVFFGPQLYLQHKKMREHQHEFLVSDAKSLESSLGVCKVIMDSTNPNLQSSRDVMRDVCTKMQNELNDVNKKLENW